MADAQSQTRFGFLFRTDTGLIDRATWWRGAVALGVPLLVLTLIWIAISPWAHRDMTRASALVDPAALAAYVYLLLYAFAVILISVCFYNLSAKRFRAMGRHPSLAGLVPLMALLAGAAHWIAPRSEGMVPAWSAYVFDALLIGVLAFTIYELGIVARDVPPPGR
jgi:magnesium-transporting ATPase (P-type)